MPAFAATAPGKIILFGEHAVVYGQPAIAVPVRQVQARAMVQAEPLQPAGMVFIQAPAVQLETRLDELPEIHPLKAVISGTLAELGVARLPACSIRISSNIPVAAGLGSGAAVSVALIRALASFLGHPLPDERVSAIAYQVEKIHHGTPSGIDNTVITYGRPVYFVRERTDFVSQRTDFVSQRTDFVSQRTDFVSQRTDFVSQRTDLESQRTDLVSQRTDLVSQRTDLVSQRTDLVSQPTLETLQLPQPFTVVIGDTGIPSPTAKAVGDLRQRWQAGRGFYDHLFSAVGSIVKAARQAIEAGQPELLGGLMDANQALLRQMGVSSPELEGLVGAARAAGALGAKLSGGGRGGNMLALVSAENAQTVAEALREAGAVNTIVTQVSRS